MVGRYKGFVAFLYQNAPNVLAIHYILQRNLWPKSLAVMVFVKTLMFFVKAVNKTEWKERHLNSRLFAAKQLLLHTEVRWLSRGESRQKLVDIFDSTVEFLREVASTLCDKLKKWEKYLFHLVNIYWKFNEIEKRLQYKNVTIIQDRTVIMRLHVKFVLFKYSLKIRSFKYF